MAAPCLRSDAPSPTRPPRWGTGTGNAGIFCVCRQYKPSLRVCYFLDKLLIDFLIFCLRKLETKQSRFARKGVQTSTEAAGELVQAGLDGHQLSGHVCKEKFSKMSSKIQE